MSLATVASQDHGHSQAVVAVWPGGRELRWLYRTCVHIFGTRLGGKQVGRMRHTARILGCSDTFTAGPHGNINAKVKTLCTAAAPETCFHLQRPQ